MTEEIWADIPGFEGAYEVSSHGHVRSLQRTTIRANGMPYTVKPRIRKICVDHRCGAEYVKLATGRKARYRTFSMRQLMADVFGGGK